MKKILTLVFVMIMALALCVSFVSCNGVDDDDDKPGIEGNGDNNNGGNNNGGIGDINAGVAGGGGTLDYNCKNGGEHMYNTPEITHTATAITSKYTCGICGHVESKTVTVDTVVGGEQGWNNAFEKVTFNNYTLRVRISENENNQVILSEDALYYQAWDNVLYTVKQADGSWTNYMSEDGGYTWEYEAGCDNGAYNAAKRMATLSITYTNFFSRFTYDQATGTYVCQDVVEVDCYDGHEIERMYCFNNVVKVADGNVIYIDCDYSFETDLSDPKHFIYDNIGMSKVTVPYNVLANAVPGSVGNPWGGGYDEEPDDEVGGENNSGSALNPGVTERYLEDGYYFHETNENLGLIVKGNTLSIVRYHNNEGCTLGWRYRYEIHDEMIIWHFLTIDVLEGNPSESFAEEINGWIEENANLTVSHELIEYDNGYQFAVDRYIRMGSEGGNNEPEENKPENTEKPGNTPSGDKPGSDPNELAEFLKAFAGEWYSEEAQQYAVITSDSFTFRCVDGSYIEYNYYVEDFNLYVEATQNYYFTAAMQNQVATATQMSFDAYIELLLNKGYNPMGCEMDHGTGMAIIGGAHYERV